MPQPHLELDMLKIGHHYALSGYSIINLSQASNLNVILDWSLFFTSHTHNCCAFYFPNVTGICHSRNPVQNQFT